MDESDDWGTGRDGHEQELMLLPRAALFDSQANQITRWVDVPRPGGVSIAVAGPGVVRAGVSLLPFGPIRYTTRYYNVAAGDTVTVPPDAELT